MTSGVPAKDEPEIREVEALVSRFRCMRPDVKLLLLVALIDEVFGAVYDNRLTRIMH